MWDSNTSCSDQIPNGGLMNKHINDIRDCKFVYTMADCPRRLDRLGSFKEECQRIQLAADSAICGADTRESRFSNVIEEDNSIENHNTVKRLKHERTDSGLLHHVVETRYTARNKGKRFAHKSSLCHNSASLIHPPPFSAGTSLSKYRIAEILGLICDQDADLKMRHVQRRAKAFVDQMFIDRRFTGYHVTSSECKPFSDALEILSTNKDLFMEFLPDPNPMLARFIRPVQDAKFSEFDSKYDTSSENGNLKRFIEKIDHKCQYASKPHFTRPLDKIVILKPAPQKTRSSENITFRCSSVQSHQKLGGKVPNPKPTSFSFKGIKRKLQHTFGGNRIGSKQLSMKGNSNKLANNRPIFRVAHCICSRMDAVNSFKSSKIVEIRENVSKKSPFRSIDRPENICMKETVRRKIDFPSVSLSKKKEFDVIFEAKRQLYASVNDVNALENMKRKGSPKTVSQMLSSPEYDFSWPISPKRGTAQMRVSNYSNSPRNSCLITKERQRICPSPLRPDKDGTYDEDYKICEGIETLKAKNISSRIPTDDHKYCTGLSETDEVDFNNGEQEIAEIDSIQKHELCTSEVESESITVKGSDDTELLEDDESAVHFVDTHSENETLGSTLDDITFTPLSSCDSTKYQEHPSPVSVLDPFFTDIIHSPPSTSFQTVERLRPLRLDFEECSSYSTPQDPQLDIKTCNINEQDQISVYVHLVLQASRMNWDHASEISPLPEELIHASLFDELEFPLIDPHLYPRLLFDHINEVLLEICEWNFSTPAWLTSIKPKIMSLPLEEVVLDEIMKEADFYVLPQTETRTLNQIVSKDISNSRMWLDARFETEQVVNQVSGDIIEELILNVLLEFHT
ncbi:hypothetical protein F511_24893 [Dorcoceras hygrometricum]|uniref:DUF4378 domain-containing protein n=1 Tax=Dorcoceras hygrometricum TaxID=472368 RepID=A0A2Z7AAW0_9LAMI|nr:hypothetical protein F511_24893 [Dorcoceras hygrometricum]